MYVLTEEPSVHGLPEKPQVDTYPEFDDPWWGDPSPQHDFYDKWVARYGPGGPEDLYRHMSPIDWLYAVGLETWLEGVKAADSFEGDKVAAGLHTLTEWQTLLGTTGGWWGEELSGINNIYMPPIHVCNIQNGVRRIVDVVSVDDFLSWWEVDGYRVMGSLEEGGYLWWQR